MRGCNSCPGASPGCSWRSRSRAYLATAVLGSLLLSSVGCLHPPHARRVVGPPAYALLPVIERSATREQILLELGTPTRSFEDGRILCFLLRTSDETGRLAAAPRMVTGLDPGHGSYMWAEYDLVTVFSEDGLLTKFSLFHFE